MTQPQSDTDMRMVGYRDKIADGMFNRDTGELRPGFRVTAEDVVVDVGCGGGMDSIFCAEQGAHVIYVDSNPNEVAVLRTRLAGTRARESTPIVSDANPLPLPDGIATRVIASEVLEHVDDPQQFLKELIRVGAPNALFMLAVPDPVAEQLQVGLAAPVYFQKPNHIRIFERNEFARLVTDAGLVIVHRGSNSFCGAIWWILFWISQIKDFSERHPLLESWSMTWATLLDMPNNGPARRALNELLPKSQYIVARKLKRPSVLGAIRRILTGTPAVPKPAATPMAAGYANAAIRLAADQDLQAIETLDAVKGGWFDFDRKEIFPGFQIVDDDAVLDAGCGRGTYSVACGKLGANLTAIDADPENVAVTTRRVAETGIRSFIPLVGNTPTLPDAGFAKIIAMDSIGRDSDPAAFLAELVRVGRPGAHYLLSVQDALQDGLQRQLAPPEYFTHTSFSRSAFEQLVSSAGLVVERVESYGFYRALWSAFSAMCNTDSGNPNHPLLTQWDRTWKLVLDSPDGHKVKQRMDNFLPRNHLIVARKP